jgi:DNA-binding response OmpR family regulator
MSKLQILFIDDDTTLQTLAQVMLNAKVFELHAVTRTVDAERVLATRHIDLIICDVMMPDEDGLKFCQRLQERGNKIPLLFLSAMGDPRTIERGMAAGAKDYLVKPFDVKELEKKIVSMLVRPASSPSKPSPNKTSGPTGWLRG